MVTTELTSVYECIDSFWRKRELFVDELNGNSFTLDEVATKVCPRANESAKGIISQFQAIEVFKKPIIAVCGLMNSGKSTLTASFLDISSRPRVNIGDVSSAGTHRFVLWVPSSWKPFKHQLFERLEGIFGTKPELLSEDPVEASSQYNARSDDIDHLSTPLVAFDRRLDSIGFAILDCPDIQRSHTNIGLSKEQTSVIRAEVLEKASHLCSGFIVIASLEQQESKDLKNVFSRITSNKTALPIYYILSKSHDDIFESHAEASAALSTIGYRGRISSIFISPRVHSISTRGYVENISYINTSGDESLIETLSSLDKTELYNNFRFETWRKLKKLFIEIDNAIEHHIKNNDTNADKVRRELLGALNSTLFSDKEQKIAISHQLLEQLQESLYRTGPFYAKVFYPFSKIIAISKKNFGKLNIDGSISLVNPSRIISFLDGKKSISMSSEGLESAVEQAFSSYCQYLESEQSYNINKDELDSVAKSIWEGKGSIKDRTKKKAPFLLTGILLIGSIISILFVPAIAVGGKAVFMAASIPEIFGIVGITAASSTISTMKLQEFFSDKIGNQQVSDMFAYLQDSLGIPRSFDTEITGLPIIPSGGLFESRLPCISSKNGSVLNEPVITPTENIKDSFREIVKAQSAMYME